MDIKEFKTIDEQIDILEKRNLIIKDKDNAYKLLENLNYYRLSGYWFTLLSNNKFLSGVYFENIIEIYEFDRKLESILLDLLAKVEINLRTHIAYSLGKISPLCYEDKSIFSTDLDFQSVSAQIEQAKLDCKNEKFFKHHINKYHGKFPIWVLVEMMTFGKLSKFFFFLKKEHKKSISEKYYPNIHHYYLAKYLYSLTVLRNTCAHHSRLYNRGLSHDAGLSKNDVVYLLSKNIDCNFISNKLFSRIITLFRVINSNEILKNFIDKIHALKERYPFTDLKYYGFPKDW